MTNIARRYTSNWCRTHRTIKLFILQLIPVPNIAQNCAKYRATLHMQSASQVTDAGYVVYDLSPCSSTSTCDPTNESRHAYVHVAWTSYYHVLTYSRLAIKVDDADTDCVLHHQTSLSHSESGSYDAWQEALAAGCSVSDNCAPCNVYALEYGNGSYSVPYIPTNPGGEGESGTGDLGGLFNDLSGLDPSGWGEAAINKLFDPAGSPDPGWIKVGATDEVCRLECLDRHTWAFARSHEYTGHAEQSNTETITMVHTPATPEGAPVTLTAIRTPYGVQRFAQPPFITYNKMTGDVTSNAAQTVCYL